MRSYTFPSKLKLVKNPLKTQCDIIVTCKLEDSFAKVAQRKQGLKHAIHVACSPLVNKAVVLQSGLLFKAKVDASAQAILSLHLLKLLKIFILKGLWGKEKLNW